SCKQHRPSTLTTVDRVRTTTAAVQRRESSRQSPGSSVLLTSAPPLRRFFFPRFFIFFEKNALRDRFFSFKRHENNHHSPRRWNLSGHLWRRFRANHLHQSHIGRHRQ